MNCKHTNLTELLSDFTCDQCGKLWSRDRNSRVYVSYDRPYSELQLEHGQLVDTGVVRYTWKQASPGHWRLTTADFADRLEDLRRGTRQRELKFNPAFRPGDIVDTLDDNGEWQFGGRIVSKLPNGRYLLINGLVIREVDMRAHQVELFGRTLAVNPSEDYVEDYWVRQYCLSRERDVLAGRPPSTVTRLSWSYIKSERAKAYAERLWKNHLLYAAEAGKPLPADTPLLDTNMVASVSDEELGKLLGNPRDVSKIPRDKLFFYNEELDFLVEFGLVIPRQPGTLFETDHGIFRLTEYSEELEGWFVDCVKMKQGSMR